MTTIPPPAEELRILDGELRQLEARRVQLLQRRAWLLGVLRVAGPAGPPPRPAGPPAPGAAPPSAQNVLLTLGGVLLTVAAIAFTVVSWGHLGIGGRSAVLGLVTLAALGVPALLLRRSLRSTAEAVAGLGLALTVLDAYALRHLALPDTGALGYAAGTSAVLAALWAGYGLLLGGLRLPLPTAVATAQLPLVLWAGAAHAGDHAMTAALLVTAALDTALALWAGVRSVRAAARVCACLLGVWGAASAGWLSARATDPAGAARAGALLLLAAAIALAAAWWAKGPDVAAGAACAGGLLVVAAVCAVPRTALPAAWTVPVHLACGIALLALVAAALPGPLRRGIAGASAVVQGLAVLWALPVAALALFGPLGLATRAWSGTPSDARDALLLELPLSHPFMAPPVLVTVAAVLVVVSDRRSGAVGRAARFGAPVLGWAAAVALPSALRLPYAAGLSAQILVTAVLLVVAARATSVVPALAATALALVSSVSTAFLSLATTAATLTTLGLLTAACLAACVRMARGAAPSPGAAALPACASVTYATALACAAGAAWELRPEHIGLLVLVVPALAALVVPRAARHPLVVPVEVTAAAAGAVALALASGDGPTLALALTLGGLIASGTALRPDRHAVGYAAGALFVLASWVRLASWEVSVPEAYTLPVTVPALFIGVLRRRRDPAASSWTAYGPGLAVTLLPSLAAAWSDPHWPRPLLLGTAALALTLLGAHHRLRAPLVLGGTVLALDALHELAPYVVQVMGVLPRWLPPALAGLLLLAVGATYEQRLRDARRFRNALDRMH
ncbi:SCO7613 C-terminal domain-containing membrane protein [Streptomyces sp. NPDC058308]|uniref:SCO7613 C-terminal domain-containing membrane protein n=1 Tax=Streptomyces sp. NPDC058308 TaxID=3346440 RepID=UPI0036E8D928